MALRKTDRNQLHGIVDRSDPSTVLAAVEQTGSSRSVLREVDEIMPELFLAQEQKACCCCAQSIKIPKDSIKKIDDETSWGHSFDVEIELLYKKTDTELKDCTLEWWEWTTWPALPDKGQKAGAWQDVFQLVPKDELKDLKQWKQWDDRFKTTGRKPCDKEAPIKFSIEDRPSIPKKLPKKDNPKETETYDGARTLYWAIIVLSAADCKACANKEVVAIAKQVLTVKDGKGQFEKFDAESPLPDHLKKDLEKARDHKEK